MLRIPRSLANGTAEIKLGRKRGKILSSFVKYWAKTKQRREEEPVETV